MLFSTLVVETGLNNLHINTDKTTTTLCRPDPAEYGTTLSLKLNNQTLPTTKHPKILGIILTKQHFYNI